MKALNRPSTSSRYIYIYTHNFITIYISYIPQKLLHSHLYLEFLKNLQKISRFFCAVEDEEDSKNSFSDMKHFPIKLPGLTVTVIV